MKKKKELTIKINFSNRFLYTFIVLGILAMVAVGVYALTPGVKPNPGHSLNELGVPVTCTAGQLISWNGTDLICTNNLPTNVSQALYGICGQNLEGICGFPLKEPAYCTSSNCQCRSGFERVVTGLTDSTHYYSCYKI